MRKVFLFFFFFIIILETNAQVSSPEQFLGYNVGTRFTPHWKIVNYFNHVAQQLPAMVKIEPYGMTYEGRPLILTVIASPQNLSNIQEIRKNNLRLAQVSADKILPKENAPAIVWLSYNVHGNEASSSEAAMLMLHRLVNPADTGAREWLKNIVIVIDPCINPDGRDRYINWYNSVAGKHFNVDPQSREHTEPWPGGRSNHYNFDLNRDWAWQTQIESQQRLKKYNEWLPHIHVDFHEQSYNAPYYFAPAQEPYHEVITTWQRDFQTLIGKNNAKYFDRNGWLYFTKGGGFDLFYPGYGDTYPTYHGAIGMTYEQGGGPGGGLGVVTQDGDTLTLENRVAHHLATGLSTVEIAAQHAGRLIKEFKKFYDDAVRTGSGEYKTFLIKRKSTGVDHEAVLQKYLSNNGVTWGYAQANANYRGFNYISGKEEPVTVEKNDIVLTAYQAHSTMLKVLFEPKSRQSEVKSFPYDITAWSLPYALGLEAYAIKEKIVPGPAVLQNMRDSTRPRIKQNGAYAYVIPWKQVSSAKVLARLLKAGVRVRYQEQPFSINGKNFDAGTLVVTKAANGKFGDRLYDTLYRAAYDHRDFNFKVEPVFTGFVDKGGDIGSNKVRVIETPEIALLTGAGTDANAAGAIWHFLERELDYPVSLINANDFARTDWRKYNVLILPNSNNYPFLTDRALNDQLKSWVRQGGKIIALEGAVEQLAKADWGLKDKSGDDKKKTETDDPYQPVKKFEDRIKDNLTTVNSGTIYKIQLDNTHPLAFGYPDYYFTLKQNDAVYEFIKEGGWNVGILKKDNYISGFLGSKAQDKLKDGLLFGVQDMGRGNVVYFSDDIIFRSFWENGKLMLCNAVFMVGQ